MTSGNEGAARTKAKTNAERQQRFREVQEGLGRKRVTLWLDGYERRELLKQLAEIRSGTLNELIGVEPPKRGRPRKKNVTDNDNAGGL